MKQTIFLKKIPLVLKATKTLNLEEQNGGCSQRYDTALTGKKCHSDPLNRSPSFHVEMNPAEEEKESETLTNTRRN